MVLLWHEPPRQVLPRRISSRPFLTSDDDLSWKVCIILSFKTCALLGMHCPWRPASTRSKPCRKHHRGFWLLWQNRRTWSLHFLICSLILLKRTSVKQEGPRPLHLAFLLQQQFVRWVNNTVFSFYLQKQNRLLAHSSTVFSKSLSVTFVWSLISPILHLWASSAVSSPHPGPPPLLPQQAEESWLHLLLLVVVVVSHCWTGNRFPCLCPLFFSSFSFFLAPLSLFSGRFLRMNV